MSKNKTIKSNAKHIIAITALFFLGISNAYANQSTCAATGNLTVANADSLLDEDNSAAAYAWLNVGMELGYGESNNYPPIGSKESGESYHRAADMFERGYGVVADHKRAEHLYFMGSQFREAKSMFKTAEKYFQENNPKDAWPLALAAADCGQPDAIVLVIERSIHEKNEEQARKYLQLGVRQNVAGAKHLLGDQYDKGTLGFDKDQRNAFTWYFSAAKDGYAKSMNAVAYYLYRGIIGTPDELAALHWYHESAKKGDADGMLAYGWLSKNRKDGQSNVADAKFFIEKSIKNGGLDGVKLLTAIN